MKLGFDVRNDVKKLIDTVPEWQAMNQTWKSLVDLSNLKAVIMKEDPSFFEKSAEGRTTSPIGLESAVLNEYMRCWAMLLLNVIKRAVSGDESGLSELVYRCLGRSLSKAEQMSDWEKRPLRETQVLYAAGDAYCLIEVYKCLIEGKVQCRADLSKFIKASLKGSSSITSTRKRKAPSEIVLEVMSKLQNKEEGAASAQENTMGQINDQSSIKLVCDNMFQGNFTPLYILYTIHTV